MNKHNMLIKNSEKTFLITLHGFFGIEEAEKFFVDYTNHTSKINCNDYSIVIVCRELAVFKPEILPYLKEAYKLYKNFKTIIFINPPKITPKSQIRRIASEENLQAHFVNTDTEAYAICKK